MRFEATLPEGRGQALIELAEELGLSRSQLMDEALALFLKAVMEARRGRRLALLSIDGSAESSSEIVTPTLALLEWTAHRQSLMLSEQAVEKMEQLIESPPAPTLSLRKAMNAHKK